MSYAYNNLAHEHVPTPKEEIALKKKQEIQIAKNKKIKIKVQKRARLHIVVSIFVLLSMTYVFVYGEVRQYEINTQISVMQGKIDKVLDDKSRIVMSIEQSMDMSKIETSAIADLGMRKATSDQIVYLNLGQQDQVIKAMNDIGLIDQVAINSSNAFDTVIEKIRNIFGF